MYQNAVPIIWRGGRNFAQLRQAEGNIRAQRARLLSTEQTVFLEVVSAHMNVVRDLAVVRLSEVNSVRLARQLRATRDLDRGLADREEQILAVVEANDVQQQAAKRMTQHFAVAEKRLRNNVTKTSAIAAEIEEVEKLTEDLRELGLKYSTRTAG